MNKKIIIILTLVISLGGISSVLVIRYHSKNQNSLEVKSKEEKQEEEQKERKEEKEEKVKPEEKEEKEEKKKEEKEEITNIPWTYTWKGEVYPLLATIIISFIVSFIISWKRISKDSKDEKKIRIFISTFFLYPPFFLIAFTIISPFILTLKKFGKRSYFRRLPKVYSICKIIIDIIICVISLLLAYGFYNAGKDLLEGVRKKDGLLKYLKDLFCCCCSKKGTKVKEMKERKGSSSSL